LPFPPWRIASAEAAKAGRPVIHMEFGQPSTSAPACAIARAHHVLDTQAQGYWESAALKERIARHYHESAGVAVDPRKWCSPAAHRQRWSWR
jgi:aspartate/methionine/tyrosine aminotransferase